MLIRNATLADGDTRDVRVRGETIDAIGDDLTTGDEERVVDASDELLLPGAIDAHVHFRQPGYDHKETWASGSRSAAAGGVTTVVDQPNTDPPTVDGAAFDEKVALAGESVVDFGINGGVTADWDPEELLARPLLALGEVFLADSTGDMGIDAGLFEDALVAATERDVTVTVHAEDASLFDDSLHPERERDVGTGVGDPRAASPEADANDADAWSAFRPAAAEIAAVERACEVAGEHDATIHIAHTSTPEGIEIANDAGMTTEVTPHHLLLSRDDLGELGTNGRMNPPLRSEERRERVYGCVVDGTVDMIATDHAPHTREEKDASIWDAPSGVPGVETMLPLLLAEARDGDLSYERVRDLVAANPADVFDLPKKGRVAEGNDADLVLVDTDETREISGEALHSNCEWTPFEGFAGVFPQWTMVRGTVVYDSAEDTFWDQQGENVR